MSGEYFVNDSCRFGDNIAYAMEKIKNLAPQVLDSLHVLIETGLDDQRRIFVRTEEMMPGSGWGYCDIEKEELDFFIESLKEISEEKFERMLEILYSSLSIYEEAKILEHEIFNYLKLTSEKI